MSGKTILLVDDDLKIVKTVQRYLQHHSYAVLVTYNSKDAQKIVRDHMPGCTVLDLMMPDHIGCW